MTKTVIVVKLGTAAITTPEGLVNHALLGQLCAQLAQLHAHHHVLLVSSGAVGSGRASIQGYKGTINQKKAAAAVGNPLLMAAYAQHFSPFSITVAQCLAERSHFNQRQSFVQLKATITELWKSAIIPIANDNDVVNDRELRFTDNDELATRLAVAFNAKKLLIGSTVDGLLDQQNKPVAVVKHITDDVLNLVRPQKSGQGTGGMLSKLLHTQMATRMGIETVIFNARNPDALLLAASGKAGTLFAAQRSSLSDRQKWLLSGTTQGSLTIDAGAAKALVQRKSLLAVGVVRILADFGLGHIIDIEDEQGNLVAMGKAKIDAKDWLKGATQVVVHANDLILL
ncbi:MAG: glutamate 5-kinase [Bacteroidetes bacterium]|nr:MAG: glutamate 5-kinase [Bacteroidota bacterium]